MDTYGRHSGALGNVGQGRAPSRAPDVRGGGASGFFPGSALLDDDTESPNLTAFLPRGFKTLAFFGEVALYLPPAR